MPRRLYGEGALERATRYKPRSAPTLPVCRVRRYLPPNNAHHSATWPTQALLGTHVHGQEHEITVNGTHARELLARAPPTEEARPAKRTRTPRIGDG